MNRREFVRKILPALAAAAAFPPAAKALAKPFFDAKERNAPELMGGEKAVLAGGYTFSQVASIHSVANTAKFAPFRHKGALEYLEANFARVALYSNNLIADRSAPGAASSAVVNGVKLLGASASSSDLDIVEAVALAVLAEKFIGEYNTFFKDSAPLIINIMLKETRINWTIDNYNGAGMMQLTPNCWLAGTEEIADSLKRAGFDPSRYFQFVDEKIVNGVKKYSWKPGARSEVIRDHGFNVFAGAIHLLMIKSAIPDVDIYRLAKIYNGCNDRLRNGMSVKEDYAQYVSGATSIGYPSFSFRNGNYPAQSPPAAEMSSSGSRPGSATQPPIGPEKAKLPPQQKSAVPSSGRAPLGTPEQPVVRPPPQ